jgi:hypothetical protein
MKNATATSQGNSRFAVSAVMDSIPLSRIEECGYRRAMTTALDVMSFMIRTKDASNNASRASNVAPVR